ncbi:MAG: AAA family ATPase, partial [Bacteroidetes bacterium]|nr:AAA family ATPase [Bacteroidota bacterium]
MITQLHIRNFRLFGSLDIDGLKRVNLFAGKNNTGKTYLLEAIRIWAANGDS